MLQLKILCDISGTGKTSSLVECVHQISKLKPNAKVLIAAQSNSACDEIGTRLLASVKLSKILRLYSSSLEREKLATCNQQLLSSSNMRNGSDKWPSKMEFESFQIVIITLISSSRLVQSDLEEGFFDYIFLDECAAATEPESLVPIVGLGFSGPRDMDDAEFLAIPRPTKVSSNLILLGDHKQLGAILSSDFAEMMGLGISLMERVMTKERYKQNPEYDSRFITQLLDNFRCHPAILQFSNSQFYDNMLRSKISDKNRLFAENWNFLPRKQFPILLHCDRAPSHVLERGTSSYNDKQVELAKFYVELLLTRGIDGQEVQEQDIGIVSPYRAQLQKLRDKLSPGIEVGTAEYYQGREKKIIIISTVKSCTSIGFLKNEKRLNVILTRAKSLMIVLGNPDTLQQDELWRTFVHFCHIHRANVGDHIMLQHISDKEGEVLAQMSAALKCDEQKEDAAAAENVRIEDMKQRLLQLQRLMEEM